MVVVMCPPPQGPILNVFHRLCIIATKFQNIYTFYLICSYHFMFKCWHGDPSERPTFSELVSLMSWTLEHLAGYMDVSTFGTLEAAGEDNTEV